MPLSAMEGKDDEHLNTLRLEIPSDSVVIKSVSRIDLMSKIVYSKEQHVLSLLLLCSDGNMGSYLLQWHVPERNNLFFRSRQASDCILCCLFVPEKTRAARWCPSAPRRTGTRCAWQSGCGRHFTDFFLLPTTNVLPPPTPLNTVIRVFA